MNTCTPVSWRVSRPLARRSALFPFAVQSEMGRMLNDFLGTGLEPANSGDGSVKNYVPAMTVHEEKDRYVVTAEVPGVSEKDIDISLADGVLTVSGEKKEEIEKTEGKIHYISRKFGSFSQQVFLETAVDEDKIDASIKEGVLTVKLPKAAEVQEKVKKVSVRAER